ncbi:MAG: hypothetical protein ACJ744_00245 [Gaiellaceae bacterium]
MVHLNRSVKGGQVSDDSHTLAVFTLPVGYRPAQVQYQPVVSTTGGQISVPGGFVEVCVEAICGVADAGKVSVYSVDNRYVSFDGVTFRAAG